MAFTFTVFPSPPLAHHFQYIITWDGVAPTTTVRTNAQLLADFALNSQSPLFKAFDFSDTNFLALLERIYRQVRIRVIPLEAAHVWAYDVEADVNNRPEIGVKIFDTGVGGARECQLEIEFLHTVPR